MLKNEKRKNKIKQKPKPNGSQLERQRVRECKRNKNTKKKKKLSARARAYIHTHKTYKRMLKDQSQTDTANKNCCLRKCEFINDGDHDDSNKKKGAEQQLCVRTLTNQRGDFQAI